MSYEVHVGTYDGPFDLLLALITAQEVDLYEVSLFTIVDGYLRELARMERLDLDVATEFLLIAATLVELKCRRLLPGVGEVDLDEDLALFEARDYLLARLLECRTFSNAAAQLFELEAAADRSVARRAGPDESFEGCTPDLLAGVTPEAITKCARRALLERVVPDVGVLHMLEDEISVADVIDELIAKLTIDGPTTFAQLAASFSSTAHLVACFLGLLELYKQGFVDLCQDACFGELQISLVSGIDLDVRPVSVASQGQATGADE